MKFVFVTRVIDIGRPMKNGCLHMFTYLWANNFTFQA